MGLLGYSSSSTELRAATDERSLLTPRLHECLKSAYPRGASGGETVDVNCREYGLMKERDMRTVLLEHLSKIESPAACLDVVTSLSRERIEVVQWKGV